MNGYKKQLFNIKLLGDELMSRLLLLGAMLFCCNSAYAGNATDEIQQQDPVDTAECFMCHGTVEKLHDRGVHNEVNCVACHNIPEEHIDDPSPETRPSVRTDHRACAQCHEDKLDDMLDTKYHMKWAAQNRPISYNHVKQPDGTFSEVQTSMPRFHVGILADLAVNRMGGRFSYQAGFSEVTPVEKLWDAVIDNAPEDGKKLGDRPSVAWRPHKMKGIANLASCLKCKTTDDMLERAYLDNPESGDPLKRNAHIMETFKTTHTSFNCNFCHDPHSAEPRIVNDILIEALDNPEYKDNEYQKNVGKSMPKVEVIEMGVRGFERKIAILDKPDSNFMCGQCHISFHTYVTLKDRDTDEGGNGVTYGDNMQTTLFRKGPLELQEYYKENNLYNAVHKETGVKYVKKEDHAQLEVVSQSKHGLAGVGCTDCHFAKKSDGTMEHQPSLPMLKVEQTCLNSGCHGEGTKSNWTKPEQAMYQVASMQQKAKNQMAYFRTAKIDLIAFLKDVKEGKKKIDKKLHDKMANALERALTVEHFWRTDYSNGFHNPELYESSILTSMGEMKEALKEAKNMK